MVPFRGVPIRLLMAGGGATLLLIAVSAASEPGFGAIALSNGETIYACFTPAGTMYLIKQPGLSEECKGNHVEVSWSIEGPQGEQGETGPQGDPGEPGPAGPAGVSGYEIVQSPVSQGLAFAPCPLGKKVLGGGFTTIVGVAQASHLTSSGQEGYVVVALNPSAPIVAEAYCATVGP